MKKPLIISSDMDLAFMKRHKDTIIKIIGKEMYNWKLQKLIDNKSKK